MDNLFKKPILIDSFQNRGLKICLVLTIIALSSCSNSDDSFLRGKQKGAAEDKHKSIKSNKVTDDLIQSISSPVEMASLIKSSGGEFNSQLVSNAGNLERFKNSYEQALNMGVFVADLGYINIHKQTMHSLNFLNAIEKIADELKVGHFFDLETLKRLSSNSSNADSLLHISTDNFNKMDKYLRLQNRSELSALIITGAWLEGFYLATNITKQKPSKELFERVAEQKINLESILEVINSFKDKPFFNDLAKEIQSLKPLFDAVKIDFKYAEPTQKEVGGKLVMVDNSTTIVKITEKQVTDITFLTNKIRNKIIK